MPVSHYCEKARWALAYKRLPHKYKNLLPGLHAKPMLKLTGQSSVPVLKDDKQVVIDSAEIINYLDAEYPRFALTPSGEREKKDALAWEADADANIGPAVRILAYSELLERPELLIPMFGYEGPWYKNFVLNKAFPKIKRGLTRLLPLTEESVKRAEQELDRMYEKLLPRIESGDYLVGGQFSRADLTVAALWAPIFQTEKYGVEWPDSIPVGLQTLAKRFEGMKPWVDKMYAKHR